MPIYITHEHRQQYDEGLGWVRDQWGKRENMCNTFKNKGTFLKRLEKWVFKGLT